MYVLHNEELNDLYSSPNIIRVIKSRRMSWAGHVARMLNRRGAGFWRGNQIKSNGLKDLDIDGWVVLEWILKKSFARARNGLK